MSIVVLGAGANGLACAVHLAKAGKKVTVLEARAEAGGLSGRRAFGDGYEVPGVRHDTSEIRPALVDALGLHAHGLTLAKTHTPLFVTGAKDDDAGLVLHVDTEAAREEIGKRSKKDVEAYAQFRAFMAHLRPVLEPLLDRAPPPLFPRGFGETIEMGLMGLKLRGLGQRDMIELLRAAPMCVADWMREQFETEILSAALAFPAVVGDFVGPWSPGTCAMQILREAMIVPGAVGGPSAVVDSLLAAAKALGVEVKTKTRVTSIRLEGDAVRALRLEGGEEMPAEAVVLAASPRLMSELLPGLSLSAADETALRTIRSRGTVAKVHLGLREPLAWRARPKESFDHVRVGGAHLDDLERAFDAAKYRELPERPVLDVTLHGGAKGEKPAASILVSAIPYEVGDSAAVKEKLLASVLTMLETHAPGARDRVAASEVLTPKDLEREYGAVGGSIHHVERAIDQMVLMRPARPFARYRAPIEGLFLGSSGSHPGPGTTLVPGVLAARAVLGK